MKSVNMIGINIVLFVFERQNILHIMYFQNMLFAGHFGNCHSVNENIGALSCACFKLYPDTKKYLQQTT